MEPRQASWGAIGLICAFTVLSMGFVGTVVPLVTYLQRDTSTTPEAIGFAIALFSAPSALLAGIGGSIIDRVGARVSLIVSGLFAVAADPLIYLAHSTAALNVAFSVAGIGFAGLTVAAPALIMATTSGARRSWAMSIWSTYPPAGLSLGLLLGGPFANAAHWRWALVLHGAAMAALTIAAGTLPRPEPAAIMRHAAQANPFSTLKEIAVVRLGIAACLPAALAYGTTLIAPTYLNRALGLTMSAASDIAAAANLATIFGGLAAGQILARSMSPLLLYAVTVATGIASQLLLFAPGAGSIVAIAGLAAWTFTIGISIAVTMSLLPHVVRDPGQGAAASGLVGQFISAASFLVPNLYFGILDGGHPIKFALLAAAALVASLLALPAWRAQAPRIAA
jgi:MFS family permease